MKSKKWWQHTFLLFGVLYFTQFLSGKNGNDNEHQQQGRKKRDILSFRCQLAKELISSFSSRQRVGGRPCSVEHAHLERLNSNLGHWPTHADNKGNCAVCLAVI